MSERSPALPIWASPRGDHRSAMRSPALGPRVGRVRFRVPFPEPWPGPGPGFVLVDASGRIWLVAPGNDGRQALVVLSPRGERVAAHPLDPEEQILDEDAACEEPAPAALRAALVAGGIWLVGRRSVELRDLEGAVLHRAMGRGAVLAYGAAPNGDLLVFRQLESFTTELVRHGVDGAIRWSSPMPHAGYLYTRALACDDRGTIYVWAMGRFGDGVSGNDRPSGGLAVVSPEGALVATPALPKHYHAWSCAAREASVILGTSPQIEIDGEGRILRREHPRPDDPDTTPWDGYRMRLVARARMLDPSLILSFYGSVTQLHRPAVDAEGVRYFEVSRTVAVGEAPVDAPVLVALDPDDRCLFRVGVTDTGALATSLSIGPEGTLLATCREGLIAIG